jgi:GNAT superfamily N-acetyltransferase
MNAPHPLLPKIDRSWRAAELNVFGKTRGPDFYLAAHCCAQSLWQEGLPAQAILMLNRAMSAPLSASEPVLQTWPLPYRALAWLMLHRPDGQFVGNPRRHWQHLATRMVEPNKELRTWRAWACWYLAKEILSESEFPPDLEQIRREGVVEPEHAALVDRLAELSPANDLEVWSDTLRWCRSQLGRAPVSVPAARLRRIGPAELPVVQQLAREIWNSCYPGILSDGQIDYMLTIWYQPDAMAREMVARDVWYALLEVESRGAVGYLSFERHPGSDVVFINKLYLQSSVHGLGLGAFALAWAAERARELGARRLQLRVNKRNAVAIRAYRRAGFGFVEDVCTDIGSGYVMDDFLMEKAI